MGPADSLGRRLADDPAALEECYQQLGPMVLSYLRRLVPPDDAEDVLQQSFLDVWRSRDRYDPDRPLAPWVLDIARKRAIDHLRRQARRGGDLATMAPETPPVEPGSFADTYAEAEVMRDALAALPAEQREALLLGYFADLTQRQIASHLGVPLGTVKALSFRGLRNLAAILVPEEDE
jgi:RNA polymerase sigma factor (sigma-70 family)